MQCRMTIESCGLSRQVVLHNRKKKHDFAKTKPSKSWNDVLVIPYGDIVYGQHWFR